MAEKHPPSPVREDETFPRRGLRVKPAMTVNGLVSGLDKFIVLVGHWAEPIQEELTKLIEKEFALPYFEFVYDEHWDLGRDWSGDMPGSR